MRGEMVMMERIGVPRRSVVCLVMVALLLAVVQPTFAAHRPQAGPAAGRTTWVNVAWYWTGNMLLVTAAKLTGVIYTPPPPPLPSGRGIGGELDNGSCVDPSGKPCPCGG
jgi:hypothetical protein